MKKKWILIIGGIIACALIVGIVVALAKPQDDGIIAEIDEKSEISKEDNISGDNNDEDLELVAPVLEWWELYNPNGFDTLTAVIYNDNDIAIDVSYDLVYYKDGKEVAKSEDFANFSILPKRNDIIWANVDIPKASEVDEIKMENVVVTESYYGAIDGKYEYLDTTDGEARFKFEFEKKPTLANITFILYNDKNGDGECGKGEIVVTSSDSIMEQVGEASFATDVYAFTDYEVYFTAQEK